MKILGIEWYWLALGLLVYWLLSQTGKAGQTGATGTWTPAPGAAGIDYAARRAEKIAEEQASR